jgi:uncharacterized hydrophobic protein (TIGR00271 family)
MISFTVFKRYIKSKFTLKQEELEQETYHEIYEGTKMEGHNLWILCFAIIIACVGLNTDSISAVIGAMLISPLMGPIVGLAFGLAINNTQLKTKGLRNWILMTVISLLASILFFTLSPFNNNTIALFSFTKANIFDIFLAFFGGMAGFIGIIKKEGTKVIAGVAVATACVPPLCTAGFGLVHANWPMFLGGLYFYLINCLFIGLATFFLARFTGYHLNKNCQPFKKTVNWLWSILIAAMLLPAIYIGYLKWVDYKTTAKVKSADTRIKELEDKVHVLDSLLKANK